jgi:RES domain-containing protein
MTPLPFALGNDASLIAWRIDAKRHAATWDSGQGSFLGGGRWNSPGRYIVYCSFDPAVTILEVAAHKTFKALDTVPHILTSLEVLSSVLNDIFIVKPDDLPNPNWLLSSTSSAGQKAFGDHLLAKHPFVVIPSVPAAHSWNLLFDANVAKGLYTLASQEPFGLDTRLHPAP